MNDEEDLKKPANEDVSADTSSDVTDYNRGFKDGCRKGDEYLREFIAAEFGELAETLQNGYGVPMRAAYAEALLNPIEVHHDIEGWEISLTVGFTTVQIGRRDAEKLRDELSSTIESAHEVAQLRANFRAQNKPTG